MVSLKIIFAEQELCCINTYLYNSLKVFRGVICEIGLSYWWHLLLHEGRNQGPMSGSHYNRWCLVGTWKGRKTNRVQVVYKMNLTVLNKNCIFLYVFNMLRMM